MTAGHPLISCLAKSFGRCHYGFHLHPAAIQQPALLRAAHLESGLAIWGFRLTTAALHDQETGTFCMALQGAGSIWHLTGSEQMQNSATHPSRNTMSDEFVCLQYITPSAATLSIRMQLNNWLGGMCTVHESVRMSPAFELPTTVSYYSIISSRSPNEIWPGMKLTLFWIGS